jgi:hypothetical protein
VAQNQQKIYEDRHRVERTFEVGDLVFLRLHPYKQCSLKKSGPRVCHRVERFSSKGFHVGSSPDLATSKLALALGQAISGREDYMSLSK